MSIAFMRGEGEFGGDEKQQSKVNVGGGMRLP